jgi:hypothetical protein
MSDRASLPRQGLQERIEHSRPGRALVSVFVVVTVLAMVWSNLPESRFKEASSGVFTPYLTLTDLRQRWNLFAPDPSRKTLQLLARITYEDGSTEDWRFPEGGRFVGAYRYYRWRKLARRVNSNTTIAILWQPTAVWIGRENADSSRRPTTVALIRRWAPSVPPGSREVREWRALRFVTVRMPPDLRRSP